MLIDPNRVEEILKDCLFRDDEEIEHHLLVDGILNPFAFSPERIDEHYPEITKFLDSLPEAFQEKTGGGWSFLNAFTDKDGNQWTGLHRTMDFLFCLGMAAGRVKSCVPRELWTILPGGMPYYVVTAERFKVPISQTRLGL
jgi:hypothetical protein